MTCRYRYAGPAEIAGRVVGFGGFLVDSVEKLRDSLRSMDGYQSEGSLTVTFIVGLGGELRVSDRRSEHVKCAGGQPVLSAGEMTFVCENDRIFVERVTNQSTGYCPEPESWRSVVDALERIPLGHPDSFDPAFVFRKCPSCSQINIIKDQWYICDVCQTSLPIEWNFG
ncbi:MAG: hypothetical protein ABI614_03580 [Planctomycetota bacterium]